jgi:hypothetical protein
MRRRLNDDGTLQFQELISALTLDTLPNQSLIGRVLRDPNIWQASGHVAATKRLTPLQQDSQHQFSQFALEIERFAEREAARRVGERHIARLLVELGGNNNTFAFLSLNPKLVYDEVRRLELGPDFTAAELAGWHGLIDTNVVLKSKQNLWEANWRALTQTSPPEPVTIWVSTTVLAELDSIPLHHKDPDVRRKATAFTMWLKKKVRTKEDLREVALLHGARLKFWESLPAETPDSEVLETANSLRDRGVRIVIITHDSLMTVRGIKDDFPVLELPDDWLVGEDLQARGKTVPVSNG